MLSFFAIMYRFSDFNAILKRFTALHPDLIKELEPTCFQQANTLVKHHKLEDALIKDLQSTSREIHVYCESMYVPGLTYPWELWMAKRAFDDVYQGSWRWDKYTLFYCHVLWCLYQNRKRYAPLVELKDELP